MISKKTRSTPAGVGTSGAGLHDAIKRNRIMISSLCLSMISAQTLSRLSRGKTGFHFSGSCSSRHSAAAAW
jgi:hypothetical protein